MGGHFTALHRNHNPFAAIGNYSRHLKWNSPRSYAVGHRLTNKIDLFLARRNESRRPYMVNHTFASASAPTSLLVITHTLSDFKNATVLLFVSCFLNDMFYKTFTTNVYLRS